MADTNDARTQLHRFYAQTDQLKVQLQALDETVPRVQVEVRLVDHPTDIEAVAFLVLMQANKSAEEDLKALMENVQSISAQKARVRAALEQSAERGLDLSSVSSVLSALTTKAVLDQIKNDLDSMNDISEMDSLTLQMWMDRLSKLISTLSNVLKKISETESQIVQNLK